MKETIFDVLMYLFEHYMEDELEILPDSDNVRTELLAAGFEQIEVNKAFTWLESLSLQRAIKPAITTSFRIFSHEEKAKLDLECLDLLMFLERSGILTSANREVVIDRALALEDEEISLEKLKWIVLLVLLSQPDEEIAFSRMEDIVYDLVPTYLN
jgi:Smg protein